MTPSIGAVAGSFRRGGGGGGSPGLILPVSGAVLILDAIEAAGTYADTDPMPTWSDLSGNGNHGTQATSGKRPLFDVDAFGSGLHGVRFDGITSARELVFPDFLTGETVGTIFAVLDAAADPPANNNHVGLWDFGGSAAFGSHYSYTDGKIYESFGSTTRHTVGDPSPSLTTKRIYDVLSKSGEFTANLDGSELYTTATNSVAWPTAPKIGVSSANSTFGGSPVYYDGWMGGIYLFPFELTTTEYFDMLDWLGTRWGITVPDAPGGSHAYWRIYISSTPDGGAQVRVGELEFRATAGGADLTTGGTPVYTSQFSSSGDNSAAAAFDGNAATAWANTGALPAGIGYQLTSASTVNQVALTCRNDAFGPGDSPTAFKVQSSDDGTNWNDEWSVTGQTGWSAGETRLFTRP